VSHHREPNLRTLGFEFRGCFAVWEVGVTILELKKVITMGKKTMRIPLNEPAKEIRVYRMEGISRGRPLALCPHFYC